MTSPGLPHPLRALHLYRHILREASYLPSICRDYARSRAQDRFRDCRSKSDSRRYIGEAERSLRYLRSANFGHKLRLRRLFYLATGRVGQRRRELHRTYLAAKPPVDEDSLEQTSIFDRLKGRATAGGGPLAYDKAPSYGKVTWLENWDMPMLRALSESQLRQQTSDWPHMVKKTTGKREVEIIKSRNIWGTPMALSVKRNRFKKHWASVLANTVPPLPEGEWEQLRDLSTTGGVDAALTRPRPRRTKAREAAESSSQAGPPAREERHWTLFATRPARAVERGSSRKMKSLTGMEDNDPRGHGRAIAVRYMSGRKLRRLCGHVWEMTPVVKRPNDGAGADKISVQWGGAKAELSPPAAGELAIFQGVDSKGQLPKPKTPRPNRKPASKAATD